jgi:hypothetical protein
MTMIDGRPHLLAPPWLSAAQLAQGRQESRACVGEVPRRVTARLEST